MVLVVVKERKKVQVRGRQRKVTRGLPVEVLVVVEDVVLEDVLVGVGLHTLGLVGAIKIVSQVHQHFSFFICVHLQNIYIIIVFNTQTNIASTF